MKIPSLTTARTAQIYREAIMFRRDYCADTHFFKMTEFWDWLSDGSENWSIKLFRSNLGDNYRRKAGVISFNGRVNLTVDEALWDRASGGCKVANFILAHEIGHLALDHHAKSAIIKNFQLFAGLNGMMANIPPNIEELEANFAAVFFQCGVALEDPRWNTLDLANRSFADVSYVKKAQSLVKLDVFQRELRRTQPQLTRVIL